MQVMLPPYLYALTQRGYQTRSNVYFATVDPEDADAVQRGCGLLAGVAMVALQCLVVVGVIYGTATPACGNSDQCHQVGTFCMVGSTDRCQYCGADHPLPLQIDPATGGTLNDVDAPDFAGFNLTAIAELCADPTVAEANSDPTMAAAGRGQWTSVSSVVSWCKSGNDALDLLFPELSWHSS